MAGALLTLAVSVGAGPGTCSSNQSGNFAAHGTGEVTDPLDRASPLQAMDEACGTTETPPDSSVVRRAPYLQQVTPEGAMVVWTSDAADAGTLIVKSPEGAVVTEVPAEVDTSARLAGRVRQFVASAAGLRPSTTYCYEIRHGAERVSGPRPMRTAPTAGGGGPVRFLALGDSGEGGADQTAVLRQMQTVPFDLMIHMGDIAYDDGRLEDFEKKFFGIYRDLLRSVPMFPTSGNHEYNTDDAKPFRQVFVLPENGGTQGKERWYSFDWGDVHFVALDTEKMNATQAAWLDEDLARNRRPWTIVYGHRPPYSSGEHGGDLNFRRVFGPVLEKHRVPLVLAGHEHHYERFRPQNGVHYVITGGGGRGTRGVKPGPETVYGESVLNFVQVTIDGDRLKMHAIDATGREFDSLEIRRNGTTALR